MGTRKAYIGNTYKSHFTNSVEWINKDSFSWQTYIQNKGQYFWCIYLEILGLTG